jgi:hypothetical protein
MALRAPVYLTQPNFWAEEGMLYFAVAWERPVIEALTFRVAGYLLLWANLATTLAALLVQAGLVPLARAPQVTALCALVAQLIPVAVIAWSRAPFWGGTLRRTAGIGLLLVGVLTDEIWLNTINSQPWLVLAAALLLLEPPAESRIRRVASAIVLALAGLSAPTTSVLAPLFVWRAWRTCTRSAFVEAAVVVAGVLVQAFCVWWAVHGGQQLPPRGAGVDLGGFAAALWMRTLVVPLAGVAASQAVGQQIMQSGGIGPAAGALLLVLGSVCLGWLVRGLRADERLPLAGAYVLVTTLTFLTAIGGTALLLRSPFASSRYCFTPGVLVLFMMLGGVRRDAGTLRASACAVVVGLALLRGAALYPSAVRWMPGWPRWPDEVRAWQVDPRRPLRIWPPPWQVHLAPPRTTPAPRAIACRGNAAADARETRCDPPALRAWRSTARAPRSPSP